MLTLLVLGALGVVATVGLLVVMVAVLLLKLILLPLRLAAGLLWLPFLLVKALLVGLAGFVLVPVGLVIAFVLAIVVGALLFVPLLPIAVVACLVWMVARFVRRPALA